MIERNNSHLDVDRLVLKIQDAVARREVEGHLEPLALEAPRPDAERTIRILLATAEQKSEVRASWSSRLNFFPFTHPRVQSVFLRTLAFVFKDQRHVNLSLVEAMRALILLNEDLRSRIVALEAKLEPAPAASLPIAAPLPLASTASNASHASNGAAPASKGARPGSIGGYEPLFSDVSDDVSLPETVVSFDEVLPEPEDAAGAIVPAPAGIASPDAVAAPDADGDAEPVRIGLAEAEVPATAHSRHEAASE